MLHSLDAEVGANASTVRNGFKWADLADGEHIELCVCTRDPETHDVQGEGVVWELWFGRFHDIPAMLLEYEHEERSRRYAGLFASMRKAYGEDFSEDSPVTVVVYRRVR
jgi:hypothetical protein